MTTIPSAVTEAGGRGQNSVTPFFLIGSPRSGTTLLQSILNRHPEICVPPETKVFAHFYRMPNWYRRRCVRRIESDLGISLCDLPGQGVDVTTAELLTQSLSRFREKVERSSVHMVGEKTPEHTAYLTEIAELFPHGKFVAIIRNGYHVAESLSRMPWLHCNLRAGGAIWAFYMRHIEDFVSTHPDRIHVVRFEDLVAEPVPTTFGILEFLGVEPDHATDCIEPNSVYDQHLFPSREVSWKDLARGAVDPQKSGPKKVLSDRELTSIEDGCLEILQRWGYVDPARLEITRKPHIGRQMLVSASLAGTAVRLPPVYLCSEFLRRVSRIGNLIGLHSTQHSSGLLEVGSESP